MGVASRLPAIVRPIPRCCGLGRFVFRVIRHHTRRLLSLSARAVISVILNAWMVSGTGRTKEAEQARVDKELANIRKHFTSNKVRCAPRWLSSMMLLF